MRCDRKSKLKKVFNATSRQLSRAVSLGSEAAVEEMHARVPRDSGDLDSTIENTDDGKGYAMVSAGGPAQSGENVDYEFPVEFGSEHDGFSIPAQPFFRPGVDRGQRVMRDNLKIKKG